MPRRPTRPTRVLRVSTENTLFQYLQALQGNRTKRHRAGELVVEGVRAINGALAHGWVVNALVYVAGRPLSSWAHGILASAPGATRVELHPDLMERLSEKEETSELLAVVATAPDTPERIRLGASPLIAILDRPVYPGNLGSIIRACDALGAGGLIVTGHGADVYDPLTVRASVGSLFALPVVRLPSHREAEAWARGHALQLVGGSGDAQEALEEVDLTRPTALVLGNETRGLSRAYRELCDVLVSIPMQGAANSLNVAEAAAIMLYEAGRQRRRAAREAGRARG